jgi:hypothetical protein
MGGSIFNKGVVVLIIGIVRIWHSRPFGVVYGKNLAS